MTFTNQLNLTYLIEHIFKWTTILRMNQHDIIKRVTRLCSFFSLNMSEALSLGKGRRPFWKHSAVSHRRPTQAEETYFVPLAAFIFVMVATTVTIPLTPSNESLMLRILDEEQFHPIPPLITSAPFPCTVALAIVRACIRTVMRGGSTAMLNLVKPNYPGRSVTRDLLYWIYWLVPLQRGRTCIICQGSDSNDLLDRDYVPTIDLYDGPYRTKP
ncbi:hypothetical protein JOM56_006916 [Amanita muscaria]